MTRVMPAALHHLFERGQAMRRHMAAVGWVGGVLVATLALSPTSERATGGQPGPAAPAAACGSSEASKPSGLVVVLPPGRPVDDDDRKAIANQYISGVAAQVDWRDVEPVQGKPDWSRLDALFAAAES